ncbi:MAG TPA: glycosyltransferase [Bacteroidia bacterium]|nr:glycosyltransferase [Bacteroidia bacterium]HNP98053.1 glycosyltransferase [Bacteroidia bacterium]
MKKILYITYYWPPSGGAGVQRSLKFIKYLPEFGIEPIVLTVNAEKASYPLLDPTLEKEVSSNLQVIRTYSFEALQVMSMMGKKQQIPYGGFANPGKEKFSQKVLRFIRGNFFIPDARKGWVDYAVKAAQSIIAEQGIDTIVISSPPHSSQLIGLKLKKKLPSLRWIADLRDPWTDIYYYKDMLHTFPAKRKDARYEREVLEQCSAAVVVSDEIKLLFEKKSAKISKENIHVIPNGYDESDFQTLQKLSRETFLITYVGTIADSYNPQVFFSVFHDLLKDYPFMRIRFVGSVSGQVMQCIEQYGLKENVELIGHVSHEVAIQHMQNSAVLLLVIPEVKNDKGILTGKLFEYLGSKRPVLGIGPEDGDAAKILNASKAGKMFSREQKSEMEKWLKDAVGKWKADATFGVEHVNVEQYSRRELSRKLAAVILNEI